MNNRTFLLSVLALPFFLCLPGQAEDAASNAVAVSADATGTGSADAGGTGTAAAAAAATTATAKVSADAQELPVKYWGNSDSAKFHRPSCPFARAMNARHVVFFHFRHEAIEAGQQPCRYCLPPFVKSVQCVLLPQTQKNKGGIPVAKSNSVAEKGDFRPEGPDKNRCVKMVDGEGSTTNSSNR
jgi:hypothetical protein